MCAHVCACVSECTFARRVYILRLSQGAFLFEANVDCLDSWFYSSDGEADGFPQCDIRSCKTSLPSGVPQIFLYGSYKTEMCCSFLFTAGSQTVANSETGNLRVFLLQLAT